MLSSFSKLDATLLMISSGLTTGLALAGQAGWAGVSAAGTALCVYVIYTQQQDMTRAEIHAATQEITKAIQAIPPADKTAVLPFKSADNL